MLNIADFDGKNKCRADNTGIQPGSFWMRKCKAGFDILQDDVVIIIVQNAVLTVVVHHSLSL